MPRGTGHFDNDNEPEQLCLWAEEELAKFQQPSVPQLPAKSEINLSFEADRARTTHHQDVEERVARGPPKITQRHITVATSPFAVVVADPMGSTE